MHMTFETFNPAYLADLAALIVSISVEGEQSLVPDKVRNLLGIREGVLDPDACGDWRNGKVSGSTLCPACLS